MILRRVIAHFRKQEWTAIGLDFLIVVIGVFVGIQVANWNASRADERLGRAYTARLTADLERDLAGRRDLAGYYRAVLDSVELTDALLADPHSDPKALLVNAYRASEVNYRPPSRATWDEIVSSGHVGLLPRGLASHIAEYFAFDTARNSLDFLGESAYRHRVRTIIPLSMQKALRAGCSDVRDELQQITRFMPDCVLDVEPGLIAATAAALRADPAVQAALHYQYSDVYSTHFNILGDAETITRALAAARDVPVAAGPAP